MNVSREPVDYEGLGCIIVAVVGIICATAFEIAKLYFAAKPQ